MMESLRDKQRDDDAAGRITGLGEPIWLLQKKNDGFFFPSFLLSLLFHGAMIAVMAATNVLPPFSGVSSGPISVWLTSAAPRPETTDLDDGEKPVEEKNGEKLYDNAFPQKGAQFPVSAANRSTIGPGRENPPGILKRQALAKEPGRMTLSRITAGVTDAEMVISRYEGKVIEVIARKSAPPVFAQVSSAGRSSFSRAVVYEVAGAAAEETDSGSAPDRDSSSPEMVFEEDGDRNGEEPRIIAENDPPVKAPAVENAAEQKTPPAGKGSEKASKEITAKDDHQSVAEKKPKSRQVLEHIPADKMTSHPIKVKETALTRANTGLQATRTPPKNLQPESGRHTKPRPLPVTAYHSVFPEAKQRPLSSSGIKPAARDKSDIPTGRKIMKDRRNNTSERAPLTKSPGKEPLSPEPGIRKTVPAIRIEPQYRPIDRPKPAAQPAETASVSPADKPVQSKTAYSAAREKAAAPDARPMAGLRPSPLTISPKKELINSQPETGKPPPAIQIAPRVKPAGKPNITPISPGPATSLPVLRKAPAPSIPEKPHGIMLPPLVGDLKLVVTGKGDYRIKVFFREFRKNRRSVPLSRQEARNRQRVLFRSARTGEKVQEIAIETTDEGIYDIIVGSADAKPVTATFVLKNHKAGSKQRTRSIGMKTIRNNTLVARVLMPEGILWEDEAYFSGDMEDSESITKFQTETGLVWREFND